METISYKIVLLLSLLAFVLNECKEETNSDSKDESLFVPSEKWQIVREGQKLPRGLHVRINLTTGKKEAKLLDTSEGSQETKAVQIGDVKDSADHIEAGKLTFSESDLKSALKNIKNDDVQANVERSKTFRSYEQLKQELYSIRLKPTSDSEILKLLVEKFKKLITAKKIDKLHILSVCEDIDSLIHQYDNAIEFIDLKGLEEVIYKNLNSSILEVKLESLKLLGSLIQNNPKTQIYAFETGALDFLLRVFVLDSNSAVKNRVVFALGCLIRDFPLAQLKFIESGGLNVFFELVTNTGDIKVQLKIVTLVYDLVRENFIGTADHNNQERSAQYSRIGLRNKLQELGWCNYLTSLLKNIYVIDRNDHDGLEKVLSAIIVVKEGCGITYLTNILYILEELQDHYNELATATSFSDDELDVDYLQLMMGLCKEIIKHINLVKKINTEL